MNTARLIQQEQPAAGLAPVHSRFPFVGRQKEIERLSGLHAKRKHVLILGPAGAGKSALVGQVRERLSLVVSGRSDHLGEICDALEPQFGLSGAGLRLLRRKQRVREGVAAAGRTVVFDGVGWTGPKVASFFESVMERAPVWICTRSELAHDIGHFWPLLVRFERVEVRAFHLSETKALVEAAIAAGRVPAEVAEIVEWLQRRSGGVARVVCELLAELVSGHYDVRRAFDLKLLDLDRRIHQAVPNGVDRAPRRRD